MVDVGKHIASAAVSLGGPRSFARWVQLRCSSAARSRYSAGKGVFFSEDGQVSIGEADDVDKRAKHPFVHLVENPF